MQRARLLIIGDDGPKVAALLARLALFEPETAEETAPLGEKPARFQQETLQRATANLDKLLAHYGNALPALDIGTGEPVDMLELSDADRFLHKVWTRCSEREETERLLNDELKRLHQLEITLERFAALDLDLGVLHREHGLLDFRVGTVPEDNVERLAEALDIGQYHLRPFFADGEVAHVLIIGPSENYPQVAAAIAAAGWHQQPVPTEFRGRPEAIRQELAGELAPLQARLRDLKTRRGEEWPQLLPTLTRAAVVLLRAAPYASLAEPLRGHGALNLLGGWLPRTAVPELQATLERELPGRHLLSLHDPLPAERSVVPSHLPHRSWLRPFLDLVGNFGVPRYGEVDPTWLFALSFIGMFGMMFGDIGHGAVIAAAAAHPRLGRLRPFVLLCGLSSMLFGLLYGSVFGFEQWLHPLWLSPLSDPEHMLSAALIAGVAFISGVTLVATRNQWLSGERHAALYGGRGLAGLALYAALLYLGYGLLTGGESSLDGLVLLPLAVVLWHIWREQSEAAIGERVLVVLVEGFEAVMSYVSGTLSFLRLAAFSLNHVALAIAVFTIAHELHQLGYWVTVVLGNIFIIALEGAIVLIQVLRLEYYEGFSRFFSGDGRAFRPLRFSHTIDQLTR